MSHAMRAILGLAFAALAGQAAAQDVKLGRLDYMEACAQCHGVSGRGDGPIAPFLVVPVPDLTGIQRANGGVFPSGVLFEIIEGGGSTSVHGTREMPAWGTRFAAESFMHQDLPEDPEVREAMVRDRIMGLVAYVATIQAD